MIKLTICKMYFKSILFSPTLLHGLYKKQKEVLFNSSKRKKTEQTQLKVLYQMRVLILHNCLSFYLDIYMNKVSSNHAYIGHTNL